MVSLSRGGLQRVQLIRKGVLFGALLLMLGLAALIRPPLASAAWEGALKVAGLLLIVITITGRAWCSLYIGGRKTAEIVDLGPYSISRNPLYVFNIIGAVGIGAQTGSLVLAAVFGLVTAIVFHFTVRREEAWLGDAFGQTYAAYRSRTPRFWPDFSAWRDTDTLEVRPRFFMTTLLDGLAFLLAPPVFWAIDHARQSGWTTSVLTLF